MPLAGPIPEGHSFFCPSCGALYAVTYLRPAGSDSNNTAKCVAHEPWLRGVQSTFPRSSLFTDLKMPSRFREPSRSPCMACTEPARE
jgi:hypothetical protein